MPGIDERWDLVFIDANKRNYVDYYEQVLPKVNNGGYIIADNTLWDNKVTEVPDSRDAQTLGILAFNDLVAQDTRIEKVILPLRDGMTIIRKK
jgi:predicted O-methyltransferase YrrM